MFKEELKKLYIKHFGLILTIVITVSEIAILNFLYQKRDFTTSTNEQYFFSVYLLSLLNVYQCLRNLQKYLAGKDTCHQS